MPELPEVETVRRGLEAVWRGRRLVRVVARRPDLRVALPADLSARLEGCRIESLSRRAKYILVHCDNGTVMLLHLGMSGRMVIVAAGGDEPLGRHDHVVFETEDAIEVRFRDPRRFGLLALARREDVESHPLLAELGCEPLEAGFGAETLSRLLAGRAQPIKTALLDQRLVAGLGNIYVCESLFRAGIDPRRAAGSVSGAETERLAAAIGAVLNEAIAAGGSSLRDHAHPSGALGTFQHGFAVYGRAGQPCPGCDCDGAVERIAQGGRSTFFCATRQR